MSEKHLQGTEIHANDVEDESAKFALRIQDATLLMESLVQDMHLLGTLSPEERSRFLMAAGKVSKPDRASKRAINREVRRRNREAFIAREEARLDQTGIRKARAEAVFETPRLSAPSEILEAERSEGTSEIGENLSVQERHCYVCKEHFTILHHFYDQMCSSCGDFNYAKRQQQAELMGRVALVTGSRVKIGYQAAILLLRSGAHVVCTTRFPKDAASRYAREPDFDLWRDRLEIFGLDLRHTPSVEIFCEFLVGHLDRLDFIINNACQTVRRPPGFYSHLMAGESQDTPKGELESGLLDAYESLCASASNRLLGEGEAGTAERLAGATGLTHAPDLSAIALLPEDVPENVAALFPEGELDADLQQVDLREKNSWRLRMHEVSAVELLEVNLVNAVAPFLLNARLKPLMLAVESRDKHIVNVSAVEGQFYRMFKTDKHPHTNMAKAALNMMTRTSAIDYIQDGIHMNAVDTGWVTDEDPKEITERKEKEHRFSPPLDIVDGAARIVDPIIDGFNTGNHVWGHFLKDYRPTDW